MGSYSYSYSYNKVKWVVWGKIGVIGVKWSNKGKIDEFEVKFGKLRLGDLSIFATVGKNNNLGKSGIGLN